MPTKPDCLLALDAGTGAGRAVLFDSGGTLLAEAYQEWNYRPAPDLPQAQEFDPEAMWLIFARLCGEVLTKADVAASRVAGVSTTSQRGGYVFLDRAGEAIYGGPNLDQRPFTHPLFQDDAFREHLTRVTGQGIRPYRLASRLTWFQSARPDFFARIATVLGLNDWLIYRLTGDRRVDPSHVSYSGLFSLADGDWSDEIIGAFGLPREIFPAVSWAGETQGLVTEEAARVTGLAPGTPVFTGAGDTQAALVGCGAIEAGQVVGVSGTTTPLQMVLDHPVVDPDGVAWTSCYVTPRRWVVEANCGLTGLSLRWLRDLLGERDYGFVNRALADIPVGSGGVLNFLGPAPARKTPLPPGRLLDVVVQGPNRAGRGELTRSLCESLAYSVRANLHLLERVTGHHPSRLEWCGGMAKNRALVELIATVAGVPVVVHPGEASALGTAMCVAIGLGLVQGIDEVAHNLADRSEVVEPDGELEPVYIPLYQRWLEEFHAQYGE